jgi:hypothetical protein
MGLLVILFLNPIGMRIFIDFIVPSNIYWRLFFILPFPKAMGVVAGTRLALPYKTRIMFEIGVTLFALALYVIAKPALTFSHYEQKINNFSIAQKIVAIAPPGAMLAPSQLYGIIPMIDGFHPQLSTRFDAINLWVTNPQENLTRKRATGFIEGQVTFFQYFSVLLKEDIVQTIVFNETIFSNSIRKRVEKILKENGFLHKKLVNDYVIFWK